MSPEEVQVQICRYVCDRFIRLRTAVDRKSLVVKFEHPEVLHEMINSCLLRESPTPQMYFPRLGAFAIAGDVDLLDHVRSGVVVAVGTLRRLFVSADDASFTWEHFLSEARKSYEALDEDTLRLGLLFLTDVGVLQGYRMNDEGTAITNFSIGEWIVKVRDPEEWLEQKLRPYRRKPEVQETLDAEESITGVELLAATADAGFDWNLLHPEIRKVSCSRFRAGHFADSVEAALKAINERVREVYKRVRGVDRDGAALMKEAFSPNNPVLRLGDLNTISGRDMQLGYMEIFAGAMTGIRNPKAHANVQIDAIRATHFLFLASLLMHKIDEAEVVGDTVVSAPARDSAG